MSDLGNIIGKRIKALRENAESSEFYKSGKPKKKMTQEELASLLDVKRTTVTAWESGRNLPETNILEEICNTFGVDLAYLFGEYEEKKYDTHKIHEKTGLSENAINTLCTWQNDEVDDGATIYSATSVWGKLLSSIITHPDMLIVMDELRKSHHEYIKLLSPNLPCSYISGEEIEDTKKNILPHLYQAQTILSKILHDIFMIQTADD